MSKYNVALLKDYIKIMCDKLVNTIYYLFHYGNNDIIVNAFIKFKYGKFIPNNLGDDINIALVESLSGKKTRLYNSYLHFSLTNYMVIGSIIENFADKNSNIWGSGAIYGDPQKLNVFPKKVLAVRGRLTRNILLQKGIDCPEVFGDPALLLPYIYKPCKKKKWDLGLIPHMYDYDSRFIQAYAENNRVHIINLKNYTDWHDVIDEIVQCRYILSSSLHGLIISDTYEIPNMWIKISDRLLGGSFKFLDYFSGVGRNTNNP